MQRQVRSVISEAAWTVKLKRTSRGGLGYYSTQISVAGFVAGAGWSEKTWVEGATHADRSALVFVAGSDFCA